MDHRPKLFATVAFFAGILVCLGFKDLYPDLERRYRRRYGARATLAGAGLEADDGIGLEDHEKAHASDGGMPEVPEGIEACIGNTPLFRIKSLSSLTGCDILGKAEVQIATTDTVCGHLICAILVSEWSWWQPQR